MSDKIKQYKIYSKDLKEFFLVDKKTYYDYYRPIWAYVKKMTAREECRCPLNKVYTCNTICVDCEYRVNNFISLDQIYDDELGPMINNVTYEQSAFYVEETTGFSPEVEAVLNTLSDIDRNICILISQGKSFSQIAEILNISKTSVNRRFDNVKKVFYESNIRR